MTPPVDRLVAGTDAKVAELRAIGERLPTAAELDELRKARGAG